MFWFSVGFVIFVMIMGVYNYAFVRPQTPIHAPLFLIACYIGLVLFGFSIMGSSKPASFLFTDIRKAEMISYAIIQDKWIYLWIMNNNEPLSVVMPYNKNMARKVNKAFRDAKKTGQPVIATRSGNFSVGEWQFTPRVVKSPVSKVYSALSTSANTLASRSVAIFLATSPPMTSPGLRGPACVISPSER